MDEQKFWESHSGSQWNAVRTKSECRAQTDGGNIFGLKSLGMQNNL